MARWFILLLSLFSLQAASAGEMKEMLLPDVVLRYDTPLAHLAEAVAKDFPALKRETESKVGWRLQGVPTIVFLRGSDFRTLSDSDLMTAFAVPRKALIVIDASKLERNPLDLAATVKHELTHLMLGTGVSQQLPKWFDEGVAQWVSGGIADIVNPGNEDLLKHAVLSGNLPALNRISGSFPRDQKGLLLAYQASRSFIEYAAKERGEPSLRRVLADAKAGRDFEQAFREGLSTDLAGLEQEWRAHLVRQHSWIGYFADRISWLLFLFGALATFAGYLRFRKRMKDYRDTDGDEDGDFPANEGPHSGE